jgi:hypothetical protein
MARVGYDVDNEGENLAAGRSTGVGAFTQWRRSPSHDAAMRDPAYRAIGIGRVVVSGSRYGTYWTAVFGDEVRAIDFDVSNIAPAPIGSPARVARIADAPERTACATCTTHRDHQPRTSLRTHRARQVRASLSGFLRAERSLPRVHIDHDGRPPQRVDSGFTLAASF